MREIKFRAWVDSYSHWHMTNDVIIDADGHFFHTGMNSKNHSSWILMQYTGLKDKNGEEIYEGDIVHADDPFESGAGLVKFQYGSYYVEFSQTDFEHMHDFEQEDLEVIGNIYENPELMKNE